MIIDAHIHLYPCYDPALALTTLARNLHALAPADQAVACLTERAGEHVFRTWLTDPAAAPHPCEPLGRETDRALRLATGAGEVTLIPGRQVVTSERLEVLALGADADLPDGMTAAATIAAARDTGALPVLTWALGKWLGRRGRCVIRLIESDPALLPADSAMRPHGWPRPRVMRERLGRVPAGSDPLPLPGGDAWMGRYAVRCEGGLDDEAPCRSLKAALTRGNLCPAGARRSIPDVLLSHIRMQTARPDRGISPTTSRT